jgi:hypothetical protein
LDLKQNEETLRRLEKEVEEDRNPQKPEAANQEVVKNDGVDPEVKVEIVTSDVAGEEKLREDSPIKIQDT